ncbi:hypothetical protein AB834_06650 [PVC group bacterium (ex Bugula neritina AB1)]|nr:hypothetical protein AB834_06650 [PVC group bacterium (ex Bugula neritina AB1)]
MLSISLDRCKGEGIFRMCTLAARRSQDLSQGAIPLLKHDPSLKVTTLALREVLGGFVFEKVSNENEEISSATLEEESDA